MDQFEAARLKHQKNLERRQREVLSRRVEESAAGPVVIDTIPEVSMEKEPVTAAIIDVKVTLPSGEFGFRLAKPSVMSNANPSKLNRNEFKNRVMEGLRPLLGGVEEIS